MQANISYKLLQAVGGGTIIGPMLLGLEKPVQIVQMNATVNDLVQAAAIGTRYNFNRLEFSLIERI